MRDSVRKRHFFWLCSYAQYVPLTTLTIETSSPPPSLLLSLHLHHKKLSIFISLRFWVQRRVWAERRRGGGMKRETETWKCAVDPGRPFPLELWRKAGQTDRGGAPVGVTVAEDSLRYTRTAIWETGAMAYETQSVSVRVCVWSLTMPHWPWTFSTPNDPGASTAQISTSKLCGDAHTQTHMLATN